MKKDLVKVFKSVICLSLFLVLMFQCNKETTPAGPNPAETARQDSIAKAKKDSLIQDSIEKNRITYRTIIFPKKKKDSVMKAFNEEFDKDQQRIILALNRLDMDNKWRADTLSVPDKFDETLMRYSPFPAHIAKLDKVDKIAFFSYPIQAYALYEHGKLVKWGPTSMGKKNAQTKRGLMFANWKKELAISTVDSDWKLPYNFNIHNTLGIGWHEYDLPGYPASHSCLRLLHDDAKYLYNWADTWVLNKGGATVKANGTPVIVFGDYGWGQRKPWKHLENEPESNMVAADELDSLVEEHLDKILAEQEKRHAVQNAQTA